MSKHVRQTPADDDFRQWFTDKVVTLKQRSEMILRDGQEHHPMLFVFERDGASVGIVPLPPFQTNLDKDIAAHLHKKLGEMSDRFDGVIMLVEAWAAIADATDYKYGRSHQRSSRQVRDPDVQRHPGHHAAARRLSYQRRPHTGERDADT